MLVQHKLRQRIHAYLAFFYCRSSEQKFKHDSHLNCLVVKLNISFFLKFGRYFAFTSLTSKKKKIGERQRRSCNKRMT